MDYETQIMLAISNCDECWSRLNMVRQALEDCTRRVSDLAGRTGKRISEDYVLRWEGDLKAEDNSCLAISSALLAIRKALEEYLENIRRSTGGQP